MITELVNASTGLSPVAPPCAEVSIRVGTLDDLPFIDRLQKMHSKQLGFFPRKQLEGYINNGWALIAEEKATADCADFADEGKDKGEGNPCIQSAESAQSAVASRLGFILSRDRYQKRDEIGAVYQLCVDPSAQRKFVGAALLKAVFDRASYGCRLFCCWCAQDIAANRFWESMGFVPLAYRAGSEKKSRVHIFWQKRIRQDDVATPWWFPSKTEGGSIRADRIVLPIPPGTHWSDAKPILLPALSNVEGPGMGDGQDVKSLPQKKRGRDARDTTNATKAQPIAKVPRVLSGGLSFTPAPVAPAIAVPVVMEKREKKPKAKADPRLIAAARELRDRWLERVNEEPMIGDGKYDLVRKALPAAKIIEKELPRLAA